VFYCTDYRFHQRILENSWIFIKKNRNTLNTKHFQNCIVYYLLFLFFSIFDINFFYFTSLWFLKKNLNFLCCFIGWIWDFIKTFCKTMVVFFKKKIEILEIENFNKIPSFSTSLLFLNIFGILFSIWPIQTCPKIMESFNVFYWKG